MKSNKARKIYLDFFNKKSHSIVKSSPIVVKNDPTLMFNNAGMNQFKDIFLGNSEVIHTRIANSQKCLRVSGKHNDLDEVGRDTYHHTMFEMLGNWSFGYYFKKEAIEWAWELLTEVYGISKNKIYVTVFAGDKNDGLEPDKEAHDIWKNLISEDRILFCDKKDNFWEMGTTGPCGPCSEIHIDIRSEEEKKAVKGIDLVNKDHPEVIEIWNLVFMEFFRKADSSLENLPKKHIDTGMGFERLCMVLQDKKSNYDTDVFTSYIELLEQISGKKYGKNNDIDVAMRVASDHIRAVGFAISDGQLPSNNGAGYVIKRILRRAISFGYRFLQIQEPFLYKLVDVLVEEMGVHFDELNSSKDLISKTVLQEEKSFLKTINQGLKRIDKVISGLKSENKNIISGKVAFELYDTFGFPLDLVQIISKENNFTVDEKGFDIEMKKQKTRSKSASEISKSDWINVFDVIDTQFVGYDLSECDIKISKYREVKQKDKSFYQIVFDKTPFYAEGGGQVGDSGFIQNKDQKIVVFDTKKEDGAIIHFTKKIPDEISASFTAKVDISKRNNCAKNHTVTHLLHQALREILGSHVQQRGSFVSQNGMRLDFSHNSKLNNDELKKVQNFVNDRINESIPLEEYRSIEIEKAKEMGAMALFGEKYGDSVRMIEFGDSRELCGGIHVKNTSEIGVFKTISESSVSSGVRRIEALTSNKAIQYYEDKLEQLSRVEAVLKNPQNTVKSVENILSENKKNKKLLDEFEKLKSNDFKDKILSEIKTIGDVGFVSGITDLSSSEIKKIAFSLKNKFEKMVFAVGSSNSGKAIITILISDSLKGKFHAGKIIKEIAREINGGGGGQELFATAGGSKVEGLNAAIEKVKLILKK